MPKLRDIRVEHHDFMKLPGIPWFPEAVNHSGVARGGIYLLSGPPGGGKTTMALQIAVDLANTGHKVLYIALEQSPADLKGKIEKQIFKQRRREHVGEEDTTHHTLKDAMSKAEKALHSGNAESRVEDNLFVDSSVSGMDALPDFLARQVLGSTGPYEEIDLIVVDSLQGQGTAPTSSRPYQRLYEFNRWAKEHSIAVILVGHITKGGAIAGPRSLEHNVDCVLYLRKAMKLRPLFVPKNRFGAERHEPLSLLMNEHGCLEKSKHVRARASNAFGFLPGIPGDLVEVQALVKLPRYGDRPGIKAPYLPRQKLEQLVGIVGALRDIDISDLTFEINCALPGGRPYRETLDLPLTISMLSSYFQRQIPPGTLFIGELDLFQNVRPISPAFYPLLAEVMTPSETSPLAHFISSVMISDQNADQVRSVFRKVGIKAEIRPVASLEAVLQSFWPDIME